MFERQKTPIQMRRFKRLFEKRSFQWFAYFVLSISDSIITHNARSTFLTSLRLRLIKSSCKLRYECKKERLNEFAPYRWSLWFLHIYAVRAQATDGMGQAGIQTVPNVCMFVFFFSSFVVVIVVFVVFFFPSVLTDPIHFFFVYFACCVFNITKVRALRIAIFSEKFV